MPVLFFRNTHTGPDFKEFREEIKDYGIRAWLPQVREALEGNDIRKGIYQGFFVLHLLSHTEGKTFEQLVAAVREYEREHRDPQMGIWDILDDLTVSVEKTLVRAEEL